MNGPQLLPSITAPQPIASIPPTINSLCTIDMSMEELQRSLAQAKLHCCLLLVEGNANAVDRDTQECQASRYQEILSKVTGEGGEELQSLAQARLHCHILEVERQAEELAKEAEEYQAVRYCQILSKLSGEHPTPDDVEPSAADLMLRILQNAPAHSTLPAVHHIQIHLVLS